MKTCLLVDDSQTVRLVVHEMLTNLGYAVTEAADGAQALKACRAGMPDLVLLDWNMPVMTGIEFLQALRATPGGGAPLVIFCTTETGVASIQRGLAAGANEYIMKPFDREILRCKLTQVGAL